ncbi:MarR family transcriptional regulator [uncultured Lactobacillus sp.]|uniref:MarR family winged helix-turn-helix transcriptional regulator n=1 Tax=uncultured Lactobacillus sp. TaxID=153152 RepID=UPI002605EFC0|nr:MarR family transcriptional regulator [uncultured Lactobacillus sp.]
MTEGTISSFFTKISNEVEKQMNDDLKCFGIDANELEILIELNHHQHGKTLHKLAKELHITEDKAKDIAKELVAKDLIEVNDKTAIDTEAGKDLCKKVEKHRSETDQTITGMLSKEETLSLTNLLKKMLKSSDNEK